MEKKLSGKHIVIVGGGSGFGLETARLALAAGAKITIGDISHKKLAHAASELGETAVKTVEADVNDTTAVASLFAEIDRIDHLFITAGKLDRGNSSALKEPTETLRQVLETRLMGPVNVLREAQHKLQPGGSVVLASGLDGIRPGKDSTFAAASTEGVVGMTRALALDLAPIRVNCVMPGLIDTPLWDGVKDFDKFANAFVTKLPLRRIGKSLDVAEGAVFLMTNGYVTGTTLHIDGGAQLV